MLPHPGCVLKAQAQAVFKNLIVVQASVMPLLCLRCVQQAYADPAMQAAAEECPSEPLLLGLPPEVLRLVWDKLRPEVGQAPVDQHALRCCCLALRDASTAWIDSMHVLGRPNATVHALTSAMAQLSRFPHQAAMHKLAWSYECEVDDHDAFKQPRGQVTALMVLAHNQLAFLRSFTLMSATLDYEEVAALVNTCPQLQTVSIQNTVVFGPAFAPLQRLRSLDCLDLGRLSTEEQAVELVVSFLPELTSLTKLRLHFVPAVEGDRQPSIDLSAVLPWVAGLRQLRHLEVADVVQEDDHEVDLPTPIVIGLAGLTHLQVDGYNLPDPCPPLACAPVLSKLVMQDQMLDTPLIRLFAAMPQLRYVDVHSVQADTDLSALPCSWEELRVMDFLLLQQLLWLPRGIEHLLFSSVFELLEEQKSRAEGSVESTCALLLGVTQLLADKPGWQLERLWLYMMPVPRAPAVAAAAHPADVLTAQQALQPSVWLPLFEALPPLHRHADYLSLDQLSAVSAEVAVQGARWLPGLDTLLIDPMSEGFSSFLAALGATAWLEQLVFTGGGELPDGTLEVLRCMAVQRASMGHRLEVRAHGWLTGDQVQQLNQAVAQHCKPGHVDCVVIK